MSKAKHLIEKIKMKAGMFAVSLTIMLLNVQNVFADVKPDEQGFGCALYQSWYKYWSLGITRMLYLLYVKSGNQMVYFNRRRTATP